MDGRGGGGGPPVRELRHNTYLQMLRRISGGTWCSKLASMVETEVVLRSSTTFSSSHCGSLREARFPKSLQINMPNQIRDLHTVDETTFPYIFEENATVPLNSSEGTVRVNIYRPKTQEKVPVLVTYAPYGKDIPYREQVTVHRNASFCTTSLQSDQLSRQVLLGAQSPAKVGAQRLGDARSRVLDAAWICCCTGR